MALTGVGFSYWARPEQTSNGCLVANVAFWAEDLGSKRVQFSPPQRSPSTHPSIRNVLGSSMLIWAV